MRRILRTRLLASVLVVGVAPFAAIATPAQAQYQSGAGFDSFHDQLAQYGDWVYSDRWGLVWQPADVPDDFRPYYSGGHWAYTGAYGWVWASDYEWGDVAFHYGRWVDDPYDGWLWIPGYTWSPGWVVWRSNARSIGWMPMPPDDNFLGGRGEAFIGISFGGVSINWNNTSDYYGYSRWYGRNYDRRRFAANWTFVDTGHMADRDYRRFAYAPSRTVTILNQTTNITNYTVVNNYVVNRSVDVRAVERASGRPVAPVAAAAVFKHPNSVMTVAAGRRARTQQFALTPHGTGIANSAPPPPPAVINRLSDHVAPHRTGGMPGSVGTPGTGLPGAGGPTHLFTKKTIGNPTAVIQFHGKPPTGPLGGAPVTTTTGPGTTTVPNAGHPTGTNPAGTTLAPTGLKGPDRRSGGMQGMTTTGPGTTTVPDAGHPTGGGNTLDTGGKINKHIDVVKPVGTPAVITTPPTMTGPGHTPTTMGGGTPPDTGNVYDKRTGQGHMTGGTGAPAGMTGGPKGHAVGGEIAPLPHPMTQPVVHPVVHPVPPPVVHTVTPPVMQTVTPPVVNTPPPPVKHRGQANDKPQSTTPDDPNKDKHDQNGGNNPPK
jgi:hypothetical protein